MNDMIAIDHLQVRYNTTLAVDIQTPLRVARGERLGILGSNGAGKTSLVNALLGLIPAQGSYQLAVGPQEIGVHMQANAYAETMAVRHIIETILDAPLAKLPQTQELIEFFDFGDCLRKRYKQLSGGQKQRLTLILVMSQEMPLVFFDEVTSGLDFETRQRLIEKLVTWYGERDTTIVMISHYYEELENLVDTVLYLDSGQVVATGRKEALFQQHCGRTVVTLAASDENRRLLEGFELLRAPEHTLAVTCPDNATEARLTTLLREANIDYKRSTNDLEIMSINALGSWREARAQATRRSA